MPYNFTHALVGLTALANADAAVNRIVTSCRDAFLIGTMGPDPYFGDAMPRPLFAHCRVDLAEKLHTIDARDLFASMLPLAASSDACRAYTLGFLCHFLLDTNAHPYIEARFPGAEHTPGEIRMDLLIADRIGNPNVPRRPRAFYATEHLAELDSLHASLARSLFSIDSVGAFSRSYRKWIAVNSLSYDPENRKLRFFGALEKPLKIDGKLTGYLVARHADPDDLLNLAHTVWRAPWDETRIRTKSMVDLFDHACAEAPALLSAAMRAMEDGDLTETLGRIGARRMDARPV